MESKEFNYVAKLVADKVGIRLEPGERWAADIKEKVIMYPTYRELSEADLGFVIHEASHLRFTNTDKGFENEIENASKKYGKSAQEIFSIFNSIEDVRIEQKIGEIFKGAIAYLRENNEYMYNVGWQKLDDMMWLNPAMYQQTWDKNLALQFGYAANWRHSVGDELADLFNETWVTPVVMKAVNNLKTELDEVPYIETCEELAIHMFKNILPKCKHLLSDYTEKDRKKQEEFDKMMEELFEDFMKFLKESEERKKKGKSGKGGKGGKGKKGEGDEESVELKRGDQGDDEEGDGEKGSVFAPGGHGSSGKVEDIFKVNEARITLDTLNNTVNEHYPRVKKAVSILKDMATVREQTGFRSGKLDPRKIKKLFTGGERIFKRTIDIEETDKDMAIAVLVDESGSMHPYKCVEACKAVGVLAKALEKARKPFAVYGFNGTYYTHKEWNKKLDISRLLEIDINASGEWCGDNNDGYAIWKTTEYLKKRPERNKVLIVFSDGSPANGMGGPPNNDNGGKLYRDYNLEEEAKTAEKVAKVYSIGIENDSVRYYYKRWKVINNTDELSTELIKIFKENTGKRIRA